MLIGDTVVFSAEALRLVEAITLGAPGGPARYGPIRLWGSVGFVAIVLAGGIALDFLPAGALPPGLGPPGRATLRPAPPPPGGRPAPPPPPGTSPSPPA